MKNIVFPFVFGREGGSSLEKLNDFKFVEYFDENYIKSKREIENIKNEIVDFLFSKIGIEKDEYLKNQLINLKRDFFNNRNVEKYANLIEKYDLLQAKLEEYGAEKEKYKLVKEKFEIDFNDVLYKSLIKLKILTNSFFLKNGFLFSSNILFEEIQKTSSSPTLINKKEKRLIISLLKYLTRSLVKTTPYSSFNSIFCLQLINDRFVPLENEFKKSNLQITNLFYHYLKEILLHDFHFRRELIVRLNSTIWQELDTNKDFHFFNNHNNNEAFKKLNVSPILLFIKDQLKGDNIKYSSLVSNIEIVSGTYKTNVENFIDVLITEGFIKIIYPASNNDKNWITNLIDFINQNDLKGTLLDVVNVLNFILETIEALESIFDADKRYKIILEAHKRIVSFLTSRNCEKEFLKKVQLQDVFYEDTLISNNENISLEIIENLSSEIKKAFHTLNNIPLKKAQRKWLGLHLTKDSKISILDFYEKIYLKKHESFILDKAALFDFDIIFNKIKVTFENFNEVNTSSIDISNYFETTYNEFETIPFGAYIQTDNNNFDTTVINNFSNGFGSNVSRFFNFLPDVFAEKVIQFYEKLFPHNFIIEIKDASIHNVNTFPPLSKSLIHLCDDNVINKKSTSVSLLDVYVKLDEHGDVFLINKDEVVLKIVNFSLEGLNRRSKFVQFIDLFNDVDNYGLNCLLEKINNHFKDCLRLNNNMISIPRINFGKKLIIQRKKWFVKKDYLTNLLGEKNKSLDEMFIQINIFVKDNFIPNEVFFKIAQRSLSNSQDDNYKPQYINFKSPIFMLLLLNLINKADSVIEITEMFPNSLDVNENGGIVKEYILNCI